MEEISSNIIVGKIKINAGRFSLPTNGRDAQVSYENSSTCPLCGLGDLYAGRASESAVGTQLLVCPKGPLSELNLF